MVQGETVAAEGVAGVGGGVEVAQDSVQVVVVLLHLQLLSLILSQKMETQAPSHLPIQNFLAERDEDTGSPPLGQEVKQGLFALGIPSSIQTTTFTLTNMFGLL
jgi:hypothetical protein